VENNEVEKRNVVQKISGTKCDFFERMKKVDKLSAGLTKKRLKYLYQKRKREHDYTLCNDETYLKYIMNNSMITFG
jgi:hypothetical protein